MGLRLRFSRLTFWNKFAFFGSLAGILSIPLAILLFFAQGQPQIASSQQEQSSKQSSPRVTRSANFLEFPSTNQPTRNFADTRHGSRRTLQVEHVQTYPKLDSTPSQVVGCTAEDFRLKRCLSGMASVAN